MRLLTIPLLCAAALPALAQKDAPETTKYRKTMPIHLELGAGINNSRYTDFGTSPINYRGFMPAVTAAIRKETDKREVATSVFFSPGTYRMNYNDISVASKSNINLSIRQSRLYQLRVFNTERWNLKLGGTADIAVTMRTNPSLMNNAIGYNAFTNLMASGKISHDISTAERHKWWFFTIKPKSRKLSWQLDAGVVNGTLANNFIYSNSSPVYNKPSLWDSHSYKLFSGFRMSSRFDYEFEVFNRNTLKLSYIWDAMMTGKNNDNRFQQVNNMLLLSFNIKMR
jgi:hypothetical protein